MSTAPHREPGGQPESPDAVLEAAAAWHDRLVAQPPSADLQIDFSRWLDESPRHLAAYERVSETWRTAKSGAHDPRMLALRHEAALRLLHRRRFNLRAFAYAAIIALAMLGGLFAAARWSGVVHLPLLASTAAAHSTDVGERLNLTLPDGSKVTLNTDSALRPAFTQSERLVILERGQAVFEVSNDANRPFVVVAHGRRFVALGTAFDVRIDARRVQITMLEGTVRVEPAAVDDRPAPSAGSEEILEAGEQLVIDEGRSERIRMADAERVASWRRGQVIFENTPLADAVAELNRYSSVRMELSDRSLGELRISGAFVTGRPDIFVEALTAYFPIGATAEGDERLILRRRLEPSRPRH